MSPKSGKHTFAALAAASAALLAFTSRAEALVVQFSTTGDEVKVDYENTGVRATAKLFQLGFSEDLAPGEVTDVKLNDAELDFDGSPPYDDVFTGTFTQTLTIVNPAATPVSREITQPFTLTTTGADFLGGEPASASLTIGAGSPVTFDLGPNGILTVEPLGGRTLIRTSFPAEFANFAEVTLAIPEPAGLPLLAAGASLALARRRRQARHA